LNKYTLLLRANLEKYFLKAGKDEEKQSWQEAILAAS
jgi:hypothetical protein